MSLAKYIELFETAKKLQKDYKTLLFIIDGAPVIVDANAAIRLNNFPASLASFINNALNAGQTVTVEGKEK